MATLDTRMLVHATKETLAYLDKDVTVDSFFD